MTLSPEMMLTAACCRWPPSPEREAAVRAAAIGVDWDRFERVVARNRVVALVHDGLRRAGVAPPPELARRLATGAATAGRTALSMAHETLRLQRLFEAAGLPVVFIKGSSLALLAYGDLGIKQSWDIDLLTTPDAALAGRRVLEAAGYELVVPPDLDDARFATLVALSIECVFMHPKLNTSVELHWRLVYNEQAVPGIDARSPTQLVPLAGAGIRTFEDAALFAYICVHGTMHGWSRIKWLADVGALLGRRDPAEIERLYRASLAVGGGRTPAVALLLCHRLFGLALPDALLAELRADRANLFIESACLGCIGFGGGEEIFTPYSRIGLKLTVAQFLLVPTGRYFRREARIRWTSAHDQLTLHLTGPARVLHHLLRLPRFAWRLVSVQMRRRNA